MPFQENLTEVRELSLEKVLFECPQKTFSHGQTKTLKLCQTCVKVSSEIMGRSFRVSEEGLQRAKEAFHLKGWTQDYLAGGAQCSRQTVAKFFAGGDVEKRFFEAICYQLNLIVAEIADLESEEGQLNTSVSVNGNREQSLATLTQKQTETDEERVPYAATGTIAKSDIPKVKAILALLQEITGDTSIKIVDIEKGSIRLIL